MSVKDVQGSRNYSEIIDNLSKQSEYQWLYVLKSTLDEEIRPLVKEWATESSELDGYLFDQYILDVPKHLASVAAYRKQYMELEEASVRQALSYQHYIDTRDQSEKLDLAEWLKKQREHEQTANQQAVSAFDKSKLDIAAGFSEISRGRADSLAEAEIGDAQRRGHVSDRWLQHDKFQSALKARHDQRGHALNFEERLSRSRRLLFRELRWAFLKASAVQKGLVNRLHIDPSDVIFPDPESETDYIEQIESWYSSAIEITKKTYYRLAEQEYLFSFDTYGKVGVAGDDGSDTVEFVPFVYRIDLTKVGRQLGYGLLQAFTVHVAIEKEDSTFNIAKVQPPLQVPLEAGAGLDPTSYRGEYRLGAVGKISTSIVPVYTQGPRIRNIDAWGVWYIRHAVDWKDASGNKYTSKEVNFKDSFLRLKVLHWT